MPNTDPWLQRWLPLIAARRGDGSILELGCGSGVDTEVLAQAGHHVVAIDRSASVLDEARRRAPSCEFHCQDLRAPFPAAAARVGVVLASLSLHYQPWQETLAVVVAIRAVLRPGGVLLCRLNSTDDHHFGASGHPQLEEQYYLVNGQPKRFFDRAAIDALCAADWTLLHCEQHVVHRFAHPKSLWEVVLENAV